MLNRICKSLLFTAMMTGVAYSFAQQLPAVTYKNPTLPVETRVADLLSRMTLEEKVGQLLCPLGWEMYEIKRNDVFPSDKFKQLIKDRKAGMLWARFGYKGRKCLAKVCNREYPFGNSLIPCRRSTARSHGNWCNRFSNRNRNGCYLVAPTYP